MKFKHWKERLAAARGITPAAVRYVRTAMSPALEAQARQVARADERWGPVPPEWTWTENGSGTRLDRPGLRDLLEFCRSNPRPHSSPGRVEMEEPTRLGRVPFASLIALIDAFDSVGWPVSFASVADDTVVRQMLRDARLILAYAAKASQRPLATARRQPPADKA